MRAMRRTGVWGAAVLLLTLSACGSSPKTHFYSLEAVPPGPHAPATGLSGPPVEVGRVALPPSLDRLSVVTRGTGDQLNVSDQDQWAAPLDGLMRQALTTDLRARLGAANVLAPGDPTPPGGVRMIAVNVQEFIAEPDGRVTLDADWNVESYGKAGPHQHETIRVPVAGAGGQAVTSAMSQATGQLADRIAAAL